MSDVSCIPLTIDVLALVFSYNITNPSCNMVYPSKVVTTCKFIDINTGEIEDNYFDIELNDENLYVKLYTKDKGINGFSGRPNAHIHCIFNEIKRNTYKITYHLTGAYPYLKETKVNCNTHTEQKSFEVTYDKFWTIKPTTSSNQIPSTVTNPGCVLELKKTLNDKLSQANQSNNNKLVMQYRNDIHAIRCIEEAENALKPFEALLQKVIKDLNVLCDQIQSWSRDYEPFFVQNISFADKFQKVYDSISNSLSVENLDLEKEVSNYLSYMEFLNNSKEIIEDFMRLKKPIFGIRLSLYEKEIDTIYNIKTNEVSTFVAKHMHDFTQFKAMCEHYKDIIRLIKVVEKIPAVQNPEAIQNQASDIKHTYKRLKKIIEGDVLSDEEYI